MDTPIVFTVSEALQGFLYLCGALITVSSVLTVLMRFFDWKNRPNQRQNERLDAAEKRLDGIDKKFQQYDSFFLTDKERLDDIDKANKVTQRAILALLSHAINGNDVDSLHRAKHELEDYLTQK
jgi:predicted negative regulator of RcsB-dependent stress response